MSNNCLSAGERPNKTPIFISGVRDTRAFLTWLRGSCHGDLTAQLKAEKLMVMPSTANGFRAAVSALRSIDGGEGVSFHTFTLPEDRCPRLLVKKLGRGMPESSRPWAFRSRVSRSCVPVVVTRTPPRTALPHALHCISGARA